MGKKDNESRIGFLKFSENLSELMGPVIGWIWNHSIVILLVIVFAGFIWRSIFHYYADGLAVSESLSIAAVELIFIYTKWLLLGFAALIFLMLIGAGLKFIGQKNTQRAIETSSSEVDEDTSSENDDYITPDVPRGIDEALLRKYLKGSLMGKTYFANKTNFDGLVDTLKIIQIGYRKGAKNGKGYTDKDIMQVASLLYQNKFMGHRGKFNEWCASLFTAMNIEVPAQIRKPVPEKKINDIFLFLTR